jgi:hypothetical protein
MKILDVPQSGSVAGVTSSRNRFGQYRRTRAIPVNPGSSFQGTVRARLAANSAAWRANTANQRAGWTSLGAMIHRTDSLGQDYTLTGLQAYVEVNNNRIAASLAAVDDAPALSTPEAMLTAVITLQAAAFSIAYTPTPLGAAEYLFVYASPQRSAGRAYESDMRLIKVSAAAAASPFVILTEYSARFGAPVLGNRVFVELRRMTLGFLSGPLFTSAVVSA